MSPSAPGKKLGGVVVPLVTPIDDAGGLDEAAVARLVELLVRGRVQGVFVLGTTGEAPSVPVAMRDRLVECVRVASAGRLLVYAGISGNSFAEAAAAGSRYLTAGADAVVAHVPSYYDLQPHECLGYFTALADELGRDLILYNIPATTGISLPLDVCETLSHHRAVVGLKDSENDPARLRELLRRMGGRTDFSVFVGTGALMAEGLLLGADGIVPSVGNLSPELCRELFDAAQAKDEARLARAQIRFQEVSTLYQRGRTLGQSLAALKAVMACIGLCGGGVLSPLQPAGAAERAELRAELARLDLVSGWSTEALGVR